MGTLKFAPKGTGAKSRVADTVRKNFIGGFRTSTNEKNIRLGLVTQVGNGLTTTSRSMWAWQDVDFVLGIGFIAAAGVTDLPTSATEEFDQILDEVALVPRQGKVEFDGGKSSISLKDNQLTVARYWVHGLLTYENEEGDEVCTTLVFNERGILCHQSDDEEITPLCQDSRIVLEQNLQEQRLDDFVTETLGGGTIIEVPHQEFLDGMKEIEDFAQVKFPNLMEWLEENTTETPAVETKVEPVTTTPTVPTGKPKK